MKDLDEFKGIIPAFYACYDEAGKVSPERVRLLARHMRDNMVKGLYVCGSSGECIYQSIAERKLVLETVMDEVGKELTIIAHVAANNTSDSVELARHAESVGVAAIASIPPIYFHLPEYSVAAYWNAISAAAPNTGFIIYNIPQLAGTQLTPKLLREMLKNPHLIGVKNSSDFVQDIATFKQIGGKDFLVFNGPDEQYIAGRLMGADGGIGGTYGVMPQLYLKVESLYSAGQNDIAQQMQNDIVGIIGLLTSGKGHMYAIIKGVMRLQGVDIGSVRAPLENLSLEDDVLIQRVFDRINEVTEKYNAKNTAKT